MSGSHHAAISEAKTFLKDSVASIRRNAFRFLSGTVLSRITGMVRDMILAYAFGTHPAIAAFYVAFRLSHLLRRLFGEGPLQSAFIPTFEELRKDSPQRAFHFFRDLNALIALFVTLIIMASIIGLYGCLHFLDLSDGNRLILKLMIILMPSLLPICLYGVNSSLLQCQKHYFTPAIAPAAFNSVVIIAALFLCRKQPYEAVPYFAAGAVISCIVQWLVTCPMSWFHFRKSVNEPLFKSVHLLSPDIRKILGPLAVGLMGIGASQINNAIDTIFARYADAAGPAQLMYGLRLWQLPLALFGIAISGALLPPLSRAIQGGNKEESQKFMDFALRRVTLFLFPCTLFLLASGGHIINFVYGRGHFDMASIYATTGCMNGYALGLLPMGFIITLAPVCYIYKDFRTPTIGAFLSLGINCTLDVIMIFFLGWNAMSVALATSVAAWANAIFLYNRLTKRLGHLLSNEGAESIIKIVLMSLGAGLVTWFVQNKMGIPSFFFIFNQVAHKTMLIEIGYQITTLATSAGIFLSTLTLFAGLLRTDDFLSLFRRKTRV